MVGYTSFCVVLSLALIIVIKFLGGGHVQQALVSLSIGNGPLCPDDESTHTHMLLVYIVRRRNLNSLGCQEEIVGTISVGCHADVCAMFENAGAVRLILVVQIKKLFKF
jgi:hypothetical protein